jgi:hypothetical protein
MASNMKFHGLCSDLASGCNRHCNDCAKELGSFEQAKSYRHWLAKELGSR